MTVAITRKELGAGELRREAGRCRDAGAARRMLALALVLEGASREEAARAAGMDRQTLRDWVHRYNAEGLAGLRDRPRSGRKPRLTPGQEAELAAVVERGPDPDRDGVVRWRRVDLQALIEARFAVRLHERSVGKVLRRLGFTRLSVQAEAPEGGRGGAGGVQKSFAELVREALPEHARGKPVEVWFQDEARVGQQGTLTRVWARRGTRPRAPRDRRYAWAYLFGAVCPERAVGAALVLPYADTEATGLHLAEIGRARRARARTPWSCSTGPAGTAAGDLAVPGNLTLLPLPRYSPELNPVENVWEYLRQNKLGHRVWPDYEAIVATCCDAWNWLRGGARPARLDHPPRVGQSGHQLRPLVFHRRLRRPDRSGCRADAHLWPFSRGKGDGGGSQDLGPDRDGDRALRGSGRARAGAPARGDVRVLATLRRFLREGTPWRSLRATSAQASGSTLRRRLADWAAINPLQRVHALLVAMLRGDPDLILDSCSVRAKRGGDLTGPNPTDRGKRGTKYHIATTGDGVPVACAATAANVNDTLLFERLFLTAFAVVACHRQSG